MSALPNVDPDRLLSVEEAAEFLQISPQVVRKWARDREIPAIRMGERFWRFRRSALMEWAADKERAAKR